MTELERLKGWIEFAAAMGIDKWAGQAALDGFDPPVQKSRGTWTYPTATSEAMDKLWSDDQKWKTVDFDV